MRPLSLVRPKPLMPFWGRSPLDRALDLLGSWGVRDALVNLHHRPGDLLRAALERPPGGVRISLSFEPEILGTGGALQRAAWFTEGGPFWILNADVVGRPDPDALRRAFGRPRTIAAVWLHPARGPRTVEVRRGSVAAFRSAAPGSPGTATLCGVHLVRPELLRYLPAAGFATLVEGYEAAMRDGWRVAAVVQDRFWADLGTPAQYLAAHAEVLAAHRAGRPDGALADAGALRRSSRLARGGVKVRGFASVSGGATVERGAELADAVLWPGARVRTGAVVREAVLADGAEAAGPARGVAVRAAAVLSAPERSALERAGLAPAALTAWPLAARGSDRSFVRLTGGGASAMLIRHGTERPENERYAGHARFLRSIGVRVPAVLADSAAERFVVMEDLGDASLGDAAAGAPPDRLRELYGRVLEQVVVLHFRGAREAARRRLSLEEPFAPPLYHRERHLFTERFVAGRVGAPAPVVRAADRELARVARRLQAAPPVLLHRDLQSSNVLLLAAGPAFIDFQGMRMGPAMYDVASLLCDPYVSLAPEVQDDLLAAYVRRAGAERARPDLFWIAAIERLCQALGAFARLGAIRGAERFLEHIPPARRMLARALERCGEDFPCLKNLAGK